MELGVTLVAGPQAAEVVEPGEAALNHPALLAEPRPVLAVAVGDPRLDPAQAQLATILVVVIAAIGEQLPRSLARPATTAGQWIEAVDQWQ